MNRKSEKFFLLIFIILLSANLSQNRARQNDQTISCLQIPVRVFLQGKPVETLKKSDFQVFMNGKSRPVQHVQIIKRSMVQKPDQSTAPRTFIVHSLVSDAVPATRHYLSYLFDHVFKAEDRIYFFFDTGIYNFGRISSPSHALEKAVELITRHGSALKKSRNADASKLKEAIDYLRKNSEQFSGTTEEFLNGGKIHQHYYMKYFKSSMIRYLNALRIFTRHYLLPDLDRHRNLMAELNYLPGNKWIIRLFQSESRPLLSKKNRSSIKRMIRNLTQRDWLVAWLDEMDNARQIKKLLADIDRTLNIKSQFPTKEFRELLYAFNWTLHTVCIQPPAGNHSGKVEQGRADAEINLRWKQVSEMTGGSFMEWPSTATEPALTPEDIYYSVSLKLPRLKTPATLQIKLPESGYQVYYPAEIRSDLFSGSGGKTETRSWNPSITEIAFRNNKLFFKIDNPSLKSERTNAKNLLSIRIQVRDNENTLLFDQKKDLSIIKDTTKISLELGWLERGKHTVIIEATDVTTAKSEIKIVRVN
jgi:hypothetical protein